MGARVGSRAKYALTAAAMLLFIVPPVWAVLQAGDEQSLPEGKARETVATACSLCHSLSKATTRRQGRSDWEKTVNQMVERGAKLSPEEAGTVVEYLAEHFGESSSQPASTRGAQEKEASGEERVTVALPPGPGRDMVVEKCSQCHGEGMWRELRQDRRKWEATVYRMVGKGALWSQEEIDTLATYLSTAFPPKSKSQGSPK